MEHNGSFFDNFNFKWGFKTQIEEIRDQINEWALIDSSGYSLPVAENQLGQSINEATNFELNSF